MKKRNEKHKTAIDGLTRGQVVRSIAHCQRKAAEIGLTPSPREKNMLPVYRSLYENRKALLESMKEGHPELWTDRLDDPRQHEKSVGSAPEQLDETKLLAELSHYQREASKLADEDGTHEQNLRLAYALLARHRSQQLETLRQSDSAGEENTPD